MAQKNNNSKKKTNTSKNTRNSSGKKKVQAQNSLFSSQHRTIADIIAIFFALFMGAVVFIEGSNVWGSLRNFFFGVFGIFAFIVPLFIIFTAVVSLLKKDSRRYKHRVIEGVTVFVFIVALCHIVKVDATLTYGEQISEAFSVFKDYSLNPEGMHYGFGVLGAVFGGASLLLTGGSKLAAGVFTALILFALVLIFYGTVAIRLASTLKKPAQAMGDYAEEKLEDFKGAYDAVAEDAKEKKNRRELKKKMRREESEKKAIEKTELPNEEKPLDEEPIVNDNYVNFDRAASLLQESLEEQLKNQGNSSNLDNIDVPFDEPYDAPLEEPPVEETIVDFEGDEPSKSVIKEIADASDDLRDAVNEPKKEEPVIKVQYKLPPLDCLDMPKGSGGVNNEDELRRKGETIVSTLKSFGVGTRIVEICQSPSVTRFELQPEPGVKISRITSLADDIAMNLAASGVRIEAPIPNKNAVGIEVPNAVKAMVTLREILESSVYRGAKSKLNVALGRDIQGVATCADLAKMPHLLVAGTTGSGKSVCLNTMIMSLLYNATPEEVKLIMIDPKKVEFTVYRSIPHLLVPVVSDARKAAAALSWAVVEMDKRYALFADNGVRNLQGYNKYAEEENLDKLPQIVIIIDELADLMMAASKEVEDSICRLAQKARAAGMHLIVATQRPSVDVITGLIKANIPSRIAFAVKSQIDSRTIIDTQGAEQLLGNGDMLFCPVGLSKPVRVQGSYVSDEEIERVIDFVTSQGEVKYDDAVMQEIELKAVQDSKKKGGVEAATDTNGAGYDDELFPEAVELILELGNCSTTMIQRKLRLGYSRAGRITDELYEKGFIGPPEGAKPRKVLITKEQWYQMQANSSVTAPKQLSIDDMATSSDSGEEHYQSVNEPNYFGSAVNSDNYDVEE